MANEKFKTSIGGQAVIEGVMMRGPSKTALSVISGDGIDTEIWDTPGAKWYSKIPFVRGPFNFISSMILGYSCLGKSAEKAGLDEEETPFEKKMKARFGKGFMAFIMAISAVLGVGLAVGLFTILPTFLAGLLRPYLHTSFMRSLVEGGIRIVIFVVYIWLVSKMEDIKRVFQFHGAEHKSIRCYEAEEELTVGNVRKHTRLHPRCGTSFILISLVVSILAFSIVTWDNILVRIVLKLLLLPIVLGISYEIIRFAGLHDNAFTRIISAPGMWLQRLTTKEPDDQQIEVAIAAIKAVIPEEKGSDTY